MSVIHNQRNHTDVNVRILPHLLKGASNPLLVIKFVNEFCQQSHPATSSASTTVLGKLLPLICTHLSLGEEDQHDAYHPWRTSHDRFPWCWKPLSTFISNCFFHRFDTEATIILGKVVKAFQSVKATSYNESLLPFLEQVAASVSCHPSGQGLSTTQAYFRYALKMYLDRYVGREPETPHRIRVPLSCTRQPMCSTAVSINHFLQSSVVRLCSPKDIHVPRETYTHAREHLDQLQKQDCVVKINKGTDYIYVSIEKTLKHFNKRRRNWEARVNKAGKQFQDIDLKVLQQVLGDAYDDIVKMRRIRLAPEGTLPVTPVPQPAPRAPKPRKGPSAMAQSAPSSTEAVTENIQHSTNNSTQEQSSTPAPKPEKEQPKTDAQEHENLTIAPSDAAQTATTEMATTTARDNKSALIAPLEETGSKAAQNSRETETATSTARTKSALIALLDRRAARQPVAPLKRPASPSPDPETVAEPESVQITGCVKDRKWKRSKKTATVALDEALARFTQG